MQTNTRHKIDTTTTAVDFHDETLLLFTNDATMVDVVMTCVFLFFGFLALNLLFLLHLILFVGAKTACK